MTLGPLSETAAAPRSERHRQKVSLACTSLMTFAADGAISANELQPDAAALMQQLA